MGITATLEQITPEQLATFLRQPKAAYDHVLSQFWDDPNADAFLESIEEKFASPSAGLNLPPGMADELRAKVSGIAADLRARRGPQLVKPQIERKQFSLEKDWHVLHYLLNGTTEGGEGPLADVVFGGSEIPDREGVMDYGPIRYLTPERVRELSAALAEVDSEKLLAKIDQRDAEAKNIYLAHTLDDPDDWSYLPEFFEKFRDFYAEAAENGNAMLLQLS